MAFKALNKLDNKLYSVIEWEVNLNGITPYCPVCNDITEIKAKGSTVMKTHFAHSKDSNCPLIKDNHVNYELLSPAIRDISNGKELIQWTQVNSYHVYNKCKELLGGKLKYQEFSDILEKATKKNIWFYKGLTKELLPYVLVINFGKFLKNTGIRTEDVYFIFDKDIYGEELFLKNKITHVWRVNSELDIDKLAINYEIQNTAPAYYWKYIKSFLGK